MYMPSTSKLHKLNFLTDEREREIEENFEKRKNQSKRSKSSKSSYNSINVHPEILPETFKALKPHFFKNKKKTPFFNGRKERES